MLNVFDRFSRESQDLLYSLQRAGYRHPTIVLEANGFLPDGVESPFLYFLGRPTGEKRGRFFNEILVPDFWEITGDASGGRISYYGQEKARIYYQGATHKRIVERVEWFNQEGQVRTVDRYDQYGRKIAVTSCDGQGNPLFEIHHVVRA